MKVITKKEFYLLPAGTLFSFFDPNVFEGLKIKGNTLFNGDIPYDFFYTDLIGNVAAANSEQLHDVLVSAVEYNKTFDLDFEGYQRDGLYQEEALYAVYSQKDITALSNKLSGCIGVD